MTCIVGYVDKKTKQVYLGSDRGVFYGVDDAEFHVSSRPKIFKRTLNDGQDEFIMGASGDCRFGDILEEVDFNSLKVLEKEKKKVDKFLRAKFIPFLKAKFAAKKEKADFEILIGIYGNIFVINDDWSVLDVPKTGFAIGAASIPAKGSLYTSHKLNKSGRLKSERIVLLALESSESNTTCCKAPFDILTI